MATRRDSHATSPFATERSTHIRSMSMRTDVASRHAVVSPEISTEIHGRALLGITEGVSPLV